MNLRKKYLNQFGDEYEIIGEYKGNKIPIKAIHHSKNGDHEINIYPKNFLLNGTRCSFCCKSRKKTNDEIISLVENNERNLKVLDIFYKERPSGRKYCHLKVKHLNCGHEFETSLSNLINIKTGCPNCAKNKKLTKSDFSNKIVEEITNKEYSLLNENFKNTDSKIEFRHNICGKIYKSTIHYFKMGYRCPFCNSSKNEKIISKILDNLNIKYIYQYSPNDLTAKKKGRKKFDFYLEEKNLIIEYDGEYHYLPVLGDRYLKETQQRDKEKNNYCKIHDINILRIPFWEQSNIENIITDVLNNKIINENVIKNIYLKNNIKSFDEFKISNKIRVYKDKTYFKNGREEYEVNDN